MLVVAKDLQTQDEKTLDSASISRELRRHFHEWLRFYLDFSSNNGHPPVSQSSLPLFMAKLALKSQPEAKRNEASRRLPFTSRWPIWGRLMLYPGGRPPGSPCLAALHSSPARR